MGTNIKNREAHQMAEELSKLTGESMTTAVTIALRERLARVRQEQGLSLADRLLAIGRDCAARLKEPFRSADHGDLLYDERGLLDEVLAPSIAKTRRATKDCITEFLADRSQNGQYFQRRSLNAALTAAARPFDALVTLLLRPTCGPCD
jgi:antitoxin VapB